VIRIRMARLLLMGVNCDTYFRHKERSSFPNASVGNDGVCAKQWLTAEFPTRPARDGLLTDRGLLKSVRVLFVSLAVASCIATSAQVQLKIDPPKSIRGAHYPALSADGKHLCFEYLGDLWIVPSEGGNARRLTVHRAYDAYPRWSPDGNWIAFSSNREGNFDVFIIPVKGGEARQLTFNSSDDFVQDWSPDGAQILFSSARDSRYADLYTISVKDSRIRRITFDKSACRYATYSPDGKTIAFTRGRQEWWRPRYKGTANSDIYSVPSTGGKATRYTTYPGIDAWPMFAYDNKTLYFVSDRNGSPNLYSVNPHAETPEQVTFHTSDPVKFPSMARHGSRIVYEQNFEIHVLDLETQKIARFGNTLSIIASSDAKDNATQRIAANAGAGPASISPDSKTLAFALRGEIWTSPVAGGDALRMTKTPAAEYSPCLLYNI
jgi:tricorn protease